MTKNLVNNSELVRDKKQNLEKLVAEKAKYEFEKKKLLKKIGDHLKEVLAYRRFVVWWMKEFITIIAFFSIISQLHSRFRHLRERRDLNRQRLLATLFAVSKVKHSMESRGKTTGDRTTTESKM